MNEVIGDGPLLLALLMGNNNNNSQALAAPQAATVVLHDRVVEVGYLEKLKTLKYEPDLFQNRMGEGLSRASAIEGLTKTQRNSFNRDGYMVVPEALSSVNIIALLKEAYNVMDDIAMGAYGTIQHLVSAEAPGPSPNGRVLATFEAANSNDIESISLTGRPINRLGCGVHHLMPAFRTLTHAPFHRAIADSLGYSNPRIVQSQLIAKSAGKGSAIVPHQDGCVSFTNPPSCLTFWYALENATLENGCLSVAKGSHLTEPLKQRLVEGAKGVPKFKALENPVWAREASPAETTGGEKELQYEPLEVKAGTLVLAHGNLMHKSAGNRSNKSRLAYTFSIVEGDLGFPNDNYMKSSVDSDIL